MVEPQPSEGGSESSREKVREGGRGGEGRREGREGGGGKEGRREGERGKEGGKGGGRAGRTEGMKNESGDKGGDLLSAPRTTTQPRYRTESSPPLVVPYLSPVVLRKELESLMSRDGSHALQREELVRDRWARKTPTSDRSFMTSL